jgi:putative tricarboxylic transport membrane protein
MLKILRLDLASKIACIGFIVLGVAAISVTGDFSPLGSVFPRTISALMIFFSCLYLVLSWLNPSAAQPKETGSNLRRAVAAFIMVTWAFALVPVGFLLSSVVAFVLLLVTAHYGSWTPRIALFYAGGATLLLGSLYLLFKVVLQVPLPQGMFL